MNQSLEGELWPMEVSRQPMRTPQVISVEESPENEAIKGFSEISRRGWWRFVRVAGGYGRGDTLITVRLRCWM